MSMIRYHPLLSADSSGTEKVPLFTTTDRDAVREHHHLWLEEISPSNFWLISKEPMDRETAKKLKIHCPACGKILDVICFPLDEHQLSLYRCKDCSRKNGGK